VRTPFVAIAQHDTLFVGPAPLRDVLSAMRANDWLKCMHFQAASTMDYVNKVKLRYGMEIHPKKVPELTDQIFPLAFWYGRTHIARSDYYREFILNRTIGAGDHLEELWGVRQLTEMKETGDPAMAHEKYGNYVLDHSEEVLYHLSGRRVQAAPEQLIGGGEDNCAGNVEKSDDSNSRGGHNLPPNHALACAEDQKCPSLALPSVMDKGSEGLPWTSARSRQADVPGLASTTQIRTKSPLLNPRGRFRQQCFACGIKGHSYRHCPNIKTAPMTETIKFG